MLLTELAEDLLRILPQRTRDKGSVLYRDGHVLIEDASEEAIWAEVLGGQRYDVGIEWEPDGSGATLSCSCDAFTRWGACKHLWAVVLQQCEGCVGGRRIESAPAPPRRRVAAVWRSRLYALPQSPRRLPSPTGAGMAKLPLFYEASVETWDSRRPITVRVHAGRSGSKGPVAGRKIRIDGPEARASRDRLDRRLIRTLLDVAGEPGYGDHYLGYCHVPEESCARVLQLLARTGRCDLVRGDYRDLVREPLSWSEDGPWELRLARGPSHEPDCTEVTGSLVRGDSILALDAPDVWICPTLFTVGGRVHEVADDGRAEWVKVLADGPLVVPEEDAEAFEVSLLELPHVPEELLTPGLVRSDVAPVPVLGLTQIAPRKPSLARIAFEYDGERVEATTRGHMATDLPAPGVVAPAAQTGPLILRDRAEEFRLASALLAHPGLRVSRSDPPDTYRVAADALLDVVGTALATGWIVEAERVKVRSPGTFSAIVSTGQDWFELQGGVDFGGVVLPLPAALKAAREKQSLVRLADGSLGMLPPGFSDAWSTLAALAKTDGDTLQFTKSQGWMLDALLAARSGTQVDEGFARHRERIESFRHIRPLDASPTFRGTLRQYQREALGWFDFLDALECGGCLADDMGLGKTIQVLALLDRRRSAGARDGPSLVVAPRSLVFNWIDEAARFTPGLRVLDYSGPDRAGLREEFADADLVVTTYGVVRRDAAELCDVRFDHAILDEAQTVKNPQSQAFKACRLLQARRRLVLTGTPVENRLDDLWTLFEFLNPGMLGRATTFRRLLREKTPDDDGRRGLLARAVRPFLLRRTKEQVAPELPERSEQVIHCELPASQRKLYDELRDHYRSLLLAGTSARRKSQDKMQVLEALLRLRQAACHTALVASADAGGRPGKAGKGEAGDSGKFDTLFPLLEDATQRGHKALVFSQFTSLLALLRARLDSAKIPYVYLDGATRDRKALVERFQEDSSVPLFLVSLKAGGVGLNLTAADYVFLLDPWWNPAVEAQAIDRTHRIGQSRRVMAYRLIAENTVEQRILELQAAKRDLAASIVTEDNAMLSGITREDLELLLT